MLNTTFNNISAIWWRLQQLEEFYQYPEWNLEQDSGCHVWSRNCLPLRSTWLHYRFLMGTIELIFCFPLIILFFFWQMFVFLYLQICLSCIDIFCLPFTRLRISCEIHELHLSVYETCKKEPIYIIPYNFFWRSMKW